jgi:hypothetical protein
MKTIKDTIKSLSIIDFSYDLPDEKIAYFSKNSKKKNSADIGSSSLKL